MCACHRRKMVNERRTRKAVFQISWGLLKAFHLSFLRIDISSLYPTCYNFSSFQHPSESIKHKTYPSRWCYTSLCVCSARVWMCLSGKFKWWKLSFLLFHIFHKEEAVAEEMRDDERWTAPQIILYVRSFRASNTKQYNNNIKTRNRNKISSSQMMMVA